MDIEQATAWLASVRDTLSPGLQVRCQVCGRPYVTRSSDKLYCSSKCRNLASLRRQVAAQLESSGKDRG